MSGHTKISNQHPHYIMESSYSRSNQFLDKPQYKPLLIGSRTVQNQILTGQAVNKLGS
jgi:hypothetical protein